VKLLALLFLIFASGKAWGYGVPAISVGEDPELLTDTPIPIPHYRATPTFTDTPVPTFTPTPTATVPLVLPTSTPTVNPITLPTERPTPSPSASLSANSFREQVFFEVGLGADPSLQSSIVPGTAAGVEAALGILFKDGFAVQLDFDYFSQSSTNAAGTESESEVLVLPTLRRYLLAGSLRPYLCLSNGLAINTTASGPANSTADSFDLALGAGLEFGFEKDFSTYVEGKYNFVFMSASPNQDIPLTLGARLRLF
jgi:hypothetical protein